MPSGTNVTITIKKDDSTSVEKTFAVYNGHSAYEIWLMAGNVGDKDDFLASLKGAKGDTGPRGPAGASTAAVKGGDWNGSYPDDMSQDDAHGKFNGGEYWKTTVPLDKVVASVWPPLWIYLQGIPCDENQVPLPYTLQVQYKNTRSATTAILVLTVFGTATQVRDLVTGTYSPLDATHGPQYTLTYWY